MKPDSLSHPQEGAEIVTAIPDVNDLVERLHPTPRAQPTFQLVPLAHVDETSDLTIVLIGRVFGDESTDEEGIPGLGVPMRGVGDDRREEVGQAVVLQVARSGVAISTERNALFVEGTQETSSLTLRMVSM